MRGKGIEEDDRLQPTVDGLENLGDREENAEAQRARRIAENARGVGGLGLKGGCLQVTAEGSEGGGEKLGAELFRLGSARGSGQGFRWGAGAVVIWAMGIGMGPSLCSGGNPSRELRASLSRRGNGEGPSQKSNNGHVESMITLCE